MLHKNYIIYHIKIILPPLLLNLSEAEGRYEVNLPIFINKLSSVSRFSSQIFEIFFTKNKITEGLYI